MTNITINTITKALEEVKSAKKDLLTNPFISLTLNSIDEIKQQIKDINEALDCLKCQTPTKVSIMVSGGVVQSAVSNDPTAIIDVYDLDESSYSSPEEQEELKITSINWDNLCSQENPPIYGIY